MDTWGYLVAIVIAALLIIPPYYFLSKKSRQSKPQFEKTVMMIFAAVALGYALFSLATGSIGTGIRGGSKWIYRDSNFVPWAIITTIFIVVGFFLIYHAWFKNQHREGSKKQ